VGLLGVAARITQPRRRPATMAAQETGAYSAEQITVLEGLEPVRKRPGMYIGSTGPRGLHHLVFEVVDNSIDEALAGHATHVDVRLRADGSVSVEDDGRGIPCDVHAKTGRPALETVLTVLHAGGKFGDSGYKVSSGLHGVGVSVVNALSEKMHVAVRRNRKLHTIDFARGRVERELEVAPLEELGVGTSPLGTGTLVTFLPDETIFKAGVVFDFETLATRFDEQAYLNAGLKIVLHDERGAEPRSRTFSHAGGIAEYVGKLCEKKTPLHDPAVVDSSRTLRGVAVDVALRWSANAYSDSILSFANGVHTPQGGSHVDGLKAAITRVLNAQARRTGKLKDKQPNLAGDFLRDGLCAIVSVKMQEAEFEGQTKNRLGNPEVRSIVNEVVADELADFVERRPKALGAILEKALAAAKASEAAKAARDLVRRKTVLGSSVLPGKLADCSSGDPAESEVFIVEGDSAGGSAKQGRKRDTQAILPLRGKILNIEKAEDAQLYGNAEVQALITALGLGMKGEPLNRAALRYHRIILMTDADVDGAHIRTLLLTFFYRYQPALIEEGFVYIAYPPLYKIRHRSKLDYCYSDAELRELIAGMSSNAKPTTQRFKGLGEMMAEELWNTTMDPAKRKLKRVTVEDIAEAETLVELLMGKNVADRKAFIIDQSESLDMQALDV
jgi:DNA gyrase subunit B